MPYDSFYDIGYTCNVMLEFDVNIGDNSTRTSKESYGGTGIGSKGFHMREFPQKKLLIVLVMVTIWFMQIIHPK